MSAPLYLPNPVQGCRCVGGPLHGRSVVLREGQTFYAVKTFNQQPLSFYDKTPDAIITAEQHRYDMTWLEVKSDTFLVRELVLLHENLLPHGAEVVKRWQELRPLNGG